MTDKTQTTFFRTACCPCGANIGCKNGLSDALLEKEGWEKIGKQWYCDECAPYKRKKNDRQNTKDSLAHYKPNFDEG